MKWTKIFTRHGPAYERFAAEGDPLYQSIIEKFAQVNLVCENKYPPEKLPCSHKDFLKFTAGTLLSLYSSLTLRLKERYEAAKIDLAGQAGLAADDWGEKILQTRRRAKRACGDEDLREICKQLLGVDDLLKLGKGEAIDRLKYAKEILYFLQSEISKGHDICLAVPKNQQLVLEEAMIGLGEGFEKMLKQAVYAQREIAGARYEEPRSL